MQKERIIYHLNEDEIDPLLEFCRHQGFPISTRAGDGKENFSEQSEGGRKVGYIEREVETGDYGAQLNIQAGGNFERVVEEYRNNIGVKGIPFADFFKGIEKPVKI